MRRSTINRRQFVTGGVAAAGLAGATLATPAFAQKKRQLTMVMGWPHNFPGLASIAYNWSKYVEELSDGELTVKVNAAGELVGASEIWDAVGSGAADCYHGVPNWVASKWQGANFFAVIPFGLNALEHAGWMYHGGGQQLHQDIWRKLLNVVPFSAGATGQQWGGWFNKEITNLDAFRGVTIRSTGITAEIYKRAGASPAVIVAAEVFPALQSGAIDAAEIVGPWLDMANGIHQHGKYYYTPGWQEPSSAGEVGLNADLYDSLSPRHKIIVERAAQAANAVNLGEWSYYNAQFFHKLRTEHKTDVRIFPDDVLKVLAAESAKLMDELGNADADSKRVYASWKPYRDQALEYAVYSDLPSLHARKLAVDAGL
ncbi:MAG: TRAP transporter substrate-binding protein [Burkholderiaceae bacterium]|jgi:TRAP-type mannitol/chloroaromatic compound transport system substrate-binding protein